VFFADSIAAISEPNLKLASALAHRCRLTVIADSAGDCRVYTRRAILMRLPQLVWSGVLDLITLVLAEIGPRVLSPWLTKQALMPSASDADLDVVVLYPFPFQRLTPGGELSYLRGSLSGFAAAEMSAELVSGCPVPIDTTVHLVPNRRHLFLFKETQALSYNVRFVLGVRRALLGRRPRFVYQRHGRFVLAGAILARLLRAPLVLEYQNSEYWWARTWDPSRFLGLIERLEDMSVRAASVIAVVSPVLRDELVSHGVPEHKIVVTPAAVDPERFRSSGSRERTRQEFGFSSDEIVVGFVGSFSHWHGIHVLERALLRLARSNGQPRRI